MQLHRLSITAFGPFADTQEIDLDALSAGGLFLLHGPTGAGKTSILDAVCFALYGDVPGARQGGHGLRSDHACPGVATRVVLETTIRGRRLRLTRSPQWDRPKKRGTGTTREQARVQLEEYVAGGWSALSARLEEVGEEVSQLLKLSREQFCQVVLLPQGQFAEFLRADADRKRRLLESLFDTQRFAKVEQWLVAQRQDCRRRLEIAEDVAADLRSRAAGVTGTDLPDGLPPDDNRWLVGLLAQARAELARLDTTADSVATARQATATALAEGQRAAALQARHAELAGRLAAVQARAERRAQAAAEIAAARRAAPVAPLVEEVARLETALVLARGEAVDWQQRLAATGTSVSGDVAPAGLRSQVEATQLELGRLDALAEVERDTAALAETVETLGRQAVALDHESDLAADWSASVEPRRAAALAALEAAALASGQVDAAALELARTTSRHEAATLRESLDANIDEATELLVEAVDIAQSARQDWLDLRARRIEGMAAELAASLTAGVGCPVCGSPDHPQPAVGDASAVTREAEVEAEDAATVAEFTRTQVEAGLATLRLQRADAAARAGGETPLVELAATVSTARQGLTTLRAAAEGREAAQSTLARLDQEIERHNEQRLALDARRATARAQVESAQEGLAALQVRVDEARGDDPSVATRVARLTALAANLDGLAGVLGEVSRLDRDRAAARRRAEEAARQCGLPGLDAVVRDARDETVLVELDEVRRRHDEELATVTELLADPDLVAAAALEPADLPQLSAAAGVADAAHTERAALRAAAAERVTALTSLAQRLDEALLERAPAARQQAVVEGLAALAEGKSPDNQLRMSLSGYVLSARLEQVAAAASERLLRMSSGRYHLEHRTEGGGSARERGGLHLRVIDAWTGVDRDPATLSGGETFSASLALALGLADVVSQEAGGSLLETLFVDEGFGSLDDDTLDEVMGVLDDLRDGGRVVGLVSHVADLRQRIPVQLRVDKGRSGSTIRQ